MRACMQICMCVCTLGGEGVYKGVRGGVYVPISLHIIRTSLYVHEFPLYAHSRLVRGQSSYAAPAVWNTLPDDIRSSNILSSFKLSLKTDLFQQSY